MNVFGSYRALLSNSSSAMLSAIEIYNKPRIEYREECFIVLLINSWELLLKAILSRNRVRIFYLKKRGESYRTLSLNDALKKAAPFFPSSLDFEPTKKNIEELESYRNKAIHYYNDKRISVIIYGLAQTSIINYRDLILECFNLDIGRFMNLILLPLSFGLPPDPIKFLSDTARDTTSRNKQLNRYANYLFDMARKLEENGHSMDRFFTTFNVSLQSIKSLSHSDLVVAVDPSDPEAKVVVKRTDPNDNHQLRQKDVVDQVVAAKRFTHFSPHTFQAIKWGMKLEDKPHLFWRSMVTGSSPQYSAEVVSIILRLTEEQVEQMKGEYKQDLALKRKGKHRR